MYKDIDEVIKSERIKSEYLKEQINSPEPGIKASKCLEMAEEHEQLAEWLEELKELRELKDTYAKGMETSYSEFRYKQGRAEGYSKAENDYFAQSQKDREDTYNCGYAIGRADAIDEFKQALKQELNKYDFWIYEIADSDGYTLETSCDRDYLIDEVAEQLKENK